MGRKRAEAAERERESRQAQRRRRLLVLVLPLLALGLACSIYLLHLYLRVRQAGAAVESFCAVSDTLNCVTVANSSYSTFLGLPIALYGVEFFALALAVVLYASSGAWRVRAWDSLLFLCSLGALPGALYLAWLSSVKIGSVCLLCAAVQGTIVLLALILLLSGRKHINSLFAEGPRELGAALRGVGAVVALVIVAAGVSQLFWAPALFHHRSSEPAGAWRGLPVQGLTIGSPNATVRVEEFTDFQCPHCGVAHQVLMQVLRRFPGKVYIIHRDFPLDMACNPAVKRPFHPHACRAAIYARCAGKQDRYWPYEELLFDNRERLFEDNLRDLASQIGLDMRALDRCLEDPHTLQAVQTDINEGISRKLTGTPTLFVNGEKLVGAPPMTYWEKKVSEAR